MLRSPVTGHWRGSRPSERSPPAALGAQRRGEKQESEREATEAHVHLPSDICRSHSDCAKPLHG